MGNKELWSTKTKRVDLRDWEMGDGISSIVRREDGEMEERRRDSRFSGRR